ncbi:ATP-binding protein [Actinophytocola sp.]|uniref:ATP-binding protein n=1 Tax=Actinophytocola sp. TaxID=1872138 RepID=UPI002D5BE10A|nr:LuxR C-terminal-related transcriptional regulator [Actinophytocola sp.]HYQ68698.1 LuxR C-terminal-related transcriptional regulator [Actinophytocola sp.]
MAARGGGRGDPRGAALQPAHPAAAPAGFPAYLDRFVGRREELGWLRAHRETQVVTLTGAPGTGKSRLAARFAELLLADDTVLGWLDLDRVRSDDEVAATTAELLGVPASSAADLAAELRDRDGLLVLDNAESLLDGCALLVQTLAAGCPRLRILTTSREILRIPSEVVIDVGPLPLPDATGAEADPSTVLRADAVQLFVERASASNPDFTLGEVTAPAVAGLCAELDGLPLALEFAARRIGMFTVTDLLDRLRRQENVLTVGNRTATARHSSIFAAFDTSHATLSTDERVVFRRLSVLSGRFRLDLAAAVCCDADHPESGLADVLSGLLAKSLVATEEDERGAGAFRLLRCVRRYAAQRLDEASERQATQRRLIAWLHGQLGRMRHSVATPGALLLRLPELDPYLEQAAECTAKHDDPRIVLLVWGLMRGRRGKALVHRTEHLVRHALRMAPAESVDRALLLAEVAVARRAAGRGAEAVELAELAVAEARRASTAAILPRALLELAACRREVGDHAGATANVEAALAVAEGADPSAGVSRCLERLATSRLAAAELDLAEAAADAALRAARGADEWTQVRALCTAADVALARGLPAVARGHTLEALRICPAEPALLPEPLNKLAVVETMRGDRGRAVRLTEAARALLGRSGLAGLGAAGRTTDLPAEWVDAGEVSLVRAAAENLSPAAARAYALGVSGTGLGEHQFATAELSTRQRVIAVLVAQGLTNSQIANRVGVSARTVAAQLAALRAALRLQSRAQVAAWARTTLR